MNQPADERAWTPIALRAAGVGLGLLGATTGAVAGWFTLSPAYATTVAASEVPVDDAFAGTALDLGSAPVHTRTGRA